MDLVLHYRIYEEGVDEQIILRYTEYTKPHYLHSLIKDHI